MAARDMLSNPGPDARGWTRWWWYGCAVAREDIDAQLAEMARAHIGGVEIQVTYPLDHDRPDRRHIDFYSPAFFELVVYLVEAARRFEIQVDFTLGSGWPFGGAFIGEDMAPVTLMPFSHDVFGPASFSFDYTCVLPGPVVRCVLVKMERAVLLPETTVDVTNYLEPVNLYGWLWGVRLADVPVPEGSYKIFTFVEGQYKQRVGKPGPGMEGYAIDHCRKDVCDLYFHTLGDALMERIGPGAFHAFFCDSIELGGNNWTGGLPAAFAARRGYDLTPYLPALWADMGPITPCVRYDYFHTFSELALESFFQNFSAHCERWGVKARVQAHGIWADILKAYGAAHIPEGETFGPHDRYDVNTVHRRLAVSAGMIYGRPIVSNESFTWLRAPRFLETPDMMKRAVDAIFCDGVNRIVNHGWSHSPADAEGPGWAFYASSMLSPRNTWWRFYPALGAYIHRVSALMQAGPIHAEVALYLPQADIWAESPMAELHMGMKLDERLGHDTMNRLQRAGFWFAYVNDEAVQTAEITDGGLRIGENLCKAVLLIRAERLPVQTARALDAFARRGGKLLAVGGYPRESPGLRDAEANDHAVRMLMDGLFAGAEGAWRRAGRGRAAVIAADGPEMTDLLAEVVPRGLCSDMDEDLGYIRRDIGGAPVYFIANMRAARRVATLSLPHAGEGFQITDALTGEGVRPLAIRDEGERLMLSLDVRENQSFVLEIGGERPVCAEPVREVESREITGWTLKVNGICLAEDLARPVGWETFEAARYFSGTGSYEAAFDAPGERALFVRLDGVCCCAEVFVNGVSAGQLWKAPYELEITPQVREGANTIRVEAVNTWFNTFLDPAREEPVSEAAVIGEWPYFARVMDTQREERLYGGKERAAGLGVQPSGLCGAVWLFTRVEETRDDDGGDANEE